MICELPAAVDMLPRGVLLVLWQCCCPSSLLPLLAGFRECKASPQQPTPALPLAILRRRCLAALLRLPPMAKARAPLAGRC